MTMQIEIVIEIIPTRVAYLSPIKTLGSAKRLPVEVILILAFGKEQR
jgi:hypothetical protein